MKPNVFLLFFHKDTCASITCAIGEKCGNGKCVSTTTSSDCNTDADCSTGETCEIGNGKCVSTSSDCATFDDCSTGETCENGKCVFF